MMKNKIISLFLMMFSVTLNAQITIEECQEAAQNNYPLVRQYDLIKHAEDYTLSNIMKGYLPQFNISAKMSYQSESTTFPLEIPSVGFKGLPKDQYQVYMEISQVIWDGGIANNNKKNASLHFTEARKQVDVGMYALRERVNNIFFGILLLDEQLKQYEILEDNLNRNLKDVENYKLNGIANDSDIDAVRVEILKAKQNREKLVSLRKSYINMMSLLTARQINNEVILLRPRFGEPYLNVDINRPELLMYKAKEQTLINERKGLKTGYMPRLSLFAQGGYGNMGFDMLKNGFRDFYIIGARLTWNLGNLYTLKNNKRNIDNSLRMIDTEREIFILNTQMKMQEQDGYIKALQEQMKDDAEIIRLRSKIRKAAEAKVANGTMSVTDLLREINEENLARQAMVMHEIELLMQQYKLKYITN